MLSTKTAGCVLDMILGMIGAAAAASLVFAVQGCANLPLGHRPESDAVSPADLATMRADAASLNAAAGSAATTTPTAVIAVASMPESATTGALSQTTTIPGGASDRSADSSKLMSAVLLGPPMVSGKTDAVVPAATTIPLGAAGAVNAEINKFIFHSPKERAQYEVATARFPNFCHDWQRMLHDRETNNLDHLTWQTRDGAQTSTYTGYGQVESCETKESIEGVPIGKISYEELIYFLKGKNADEARHARPKLIHQTHTLEIFSWEKDRWFY
jgi:hypothetical protein